MSDELGEMARRLSEYTHYASGEGYGDLAEVLSDAADLLARVAAERDEAVRKLKAWEDAEADDVKHWHDLAVAKERRDGSEVLWSERARAAEAEHDRLREALREAERVVDKFIYPKPDVGPDHPYSALKRIRAALAATEARDE